MTAPVLFDYDGQELRSAMVDGEVWFVAADVARILGYRMASDLTRRLDAEDRGTRSVRTPSGDQEMIVISEAGLFDAVLGSQVVGARDFKRWITHEVLPQIRRTGQFGQQVALPSKVELAQMVIEAETAREIAEARVAELEPKAEVADRLLDADGDMSVADAAKALSRAGMQLGATRLFTVLSQRGWIYRGIADQRWHVKQPAINSGYMSVLPQSHYHPRTGLLVLDAPQPRVTPKGLQKLLTDHGALVPA